jgi:predicted MFS family arabinose efflux permease
MTPLASRAPSVRWRELAEATVLTLASCLMALIYTVPAPVLFQIGKEYGPWIAQGIGNLPSLGIIIGGPIAGYLARRFKFRWILVSSLCVYTLIGPMAIFLRNPYALLGSRFVLGLTTAIGVSASVALLSVRYADEARARMLGLQGGVAGFVGLAAIFLSGQIAAGHNWRTPFVLYLFALPMLLLSIAAPSRPRPSPAAASAGATWTFSAHWKYLLLVTLLFCASFSTGLQLSFKLGEHGILDPSAQSYVILCAALFNALGSTLYGFLFTALGEYAITLLLLSLMAAGALTIGAATFAGPIAVGAALMGFGGGLGGPHMLVRALNRVAVADRGSVTGLFYSSIFVGEFLNPVLMQPLRSSVGTDGAFLVLGGALAAATLIAMFRMKKCQR